MGAPPVTAAGNRTRPSRRPGGLASVPPGQATSFACPKTPGGSGRLEQVFVITSTCKGGGYVYCRTDPSHPRANSNGLYPLHRVLAENRLGRLLEPEEVVHHRDEDKTNNDPSNLEVLTRSAHSAHHRPEVAKVACECPVCGKTFHLKPSVKRRRESLTKGPITCSRRCGVASGNATRGLSGHSYRTGCRCDECREEHRQVQRRYRARKASNAAPRTTSKSPVS
jgi:hypothetical protein